MYIINYDKARNRIYLKIQGNMSSSQSERYTDDMIGVISQAITGFTVFADLSESDLSVLQDGGNFAGVREYAVKQGVQGVVTLVCPEAYKMHLEHPFDGIKNVFGTMKDAQEYLNILSSK